MHVHGALLSRFALKERGHGGRRPDEQGGSSFLVGRRRVRSPECTTPDQRTRFVDIQHPGESLTFTTVGAARLISLG